MDSGDGVLSGHRVARAGLALALLATLVSCRQSVDLAAVRKLAASVKDAGPAYTSLANDYYTVCLQSNGWQRLVDFESAAGSRPGDGARADGARAICDTVDKPVSHDWNEVNGVVLAYVAALGTVAGGEKPEDFGLGAVTGKIHGLTSAQGTDLGNFLNALANAVVDSKRRAAIAATAPQADRALRTLAILQTAAAHSYQLQLRIERGRIDSFYRNAFDRVPPGAARAQLIAGEVQWQSELDDVDKRSAAADAYVASVTTLAEHHHSLVAAIAADRFDTLDATCTDLIAEFGPNVQTLSDVFGAKSAKH